MCEGCREFPKLVISNAKVSPDDLVKDVIVVNGDNPGPVLVAVKLQHWHGIKKHLSNEMDGTAMVTYPMSHSVWAFFHVRLHARKPERDILVSFTFHAPVLLVISFFIGVNSQIFFYSAAATIPFGRLFQAGGPSPPECLVVIDSGFSFTHVVPIINSQIQWYAVKRLDVGGKLMTNHLKELVSYRQWNMMDETYIMNHAKETCCYVSTRFFEDLETCTVASGFPTRSYQPLTKSFTWKMSDLQFPNYYSVPMTSDTLILHHQMNYILLGLEQSGLAATVTASIALLPDDLRGMFWANIGQIGGSTNFPGFYERLSSELLSLTPVEYDLQIYRSEDAVTEAYRSAIAFANDPAFPTHVVTREEYLEVGSNASRRTFPGWQSSSAPGDAEISKITQESMVEDRGQLSRKPSRSRMRTAGRRK
ncbi:hypothetical protein DFJ58DRAFT_917398 [Suillus subalutaceus]|uniref:uncharacterized protein n=1 Tax=Suillus subalutaceus TaxID=48586 RepID=UPI001B87ACA6|nr:uncharacterized protein DFJ58DRAFT_917398 [Suillus subalutaceus]KAG1837315.1 hypothetical protein DFJ58DRAFT_917398 [Suillus subalutaceus]